MRLGTAIGRGSLAAMRAETPTPLQRAWRLVLAAAAIGYRAGIAVRAGVFASGLRPIRRLTCRVICIGNLTVGGTGKTPCTIALARWLLARGQGVGILLRGYGRRGEGIAVVPGGQDSLARWETVGDEAALLARRLPGVPVVVGGDRFRAGQEALRRFQPDVLLLDDGFQHRQLHRDLDLVMVDATDPFGGGQLLPRGRLREPVAGLRRAHAIVLSRTDQASDLAGLRQDLERIAPGAAQILARHRPSGLTSLAGSAEHPPAFLAGRRVLALSGIANPEAFQRTLIDLGGVLAGRLAFPDHHPYEAADVLRANRAADQAAAELIVTTEKDAVRIAPLQVAERFSRPIVVLQVDLEVTEGMDALEALLLRCMGVRCG